LLTPTSRRFTEATYYPDLEGPAEHIIADPVTPAVWLHPLRREGQPTVHRKPVCCHTGCRATRQHRAEVASGGVLPLYFMFFMLATAEEFRR
jgi:hypothetical protein